VTETRIYELSGLAQGIGFRPAVYRLAKDHGLSGWVQNRPGGVTVKLEGSPENIDRMLAALTKTPPPGAEIKSVRLLSCEKGGDSDGGFRIIQSSTGDSVRAVLSPDRALCERCAAELCAPGDRRYNYPLITCALCGPRHSISHAAPYDRKNTSMSGFELCAECRAEYEDPAGRRFHAETISCPKCGPEVFMTDSSGHRLRNMDAIHFAIMELLNGKIAALKGIGGFHSAVNPFDSAALARLRKLKNRPSKALALMAADIRAVKELCYVSETEESALTSPAAPIVILRAREDAVREAGLPLELLSPDSPELGFMLAYSPLHRLLLSEFGKLHPGGPAVLVMTSGNREGCPMIIENAEAETQLTGAADVFLYHNRPIARRLDDSVAAENGPGNIQIWRRARGFTPNPEPLPRRVKPVVLALGPELKNTVTLAFDGEAVMSPHNGDLDSAETAEEFERAALEPLTYHRRKPDIIAVDLHPDYHSTVFGEKLSSEMDVPLVRVQHHHAHAVSCMTEHGLSSALALVFDGTGYGADGSIWGAELMEVSLSAFKRLGHFAPCPLPGGDAAVLHPRRQLAGRFFSAGAEPGAPENFGVSPDNYNVWLKQCESHLNAPLSNSAGRLFDSFAALIGLAPERAGHEGQAAVRLEAAARRAADGGKSCFAGLGTGDSFSLAEGAEGMMIIDWSPLFRASAGMDPRAFSEQEKASAALFFHGAVAAAAFKMLEFGLRKSGARDIVLSGGCFMSRVLTALILGKVKSLPAKTHIHSRIPPNDGGVSLGQAVIAGEKNV
jgi:hydrogenase maturation protein HypF